MSADLVDAVRARFVAHLLPPEAAAALQTALMDAAVAALDAPADRAVTQARWDAVQLLKSQGARWPELLRAQWSERTNPVPPPAPAATQFGTTQAGMLDLSLVDDETIAYEIAVSRLTLAIQDPCTWEFADLRARIVQLMGASDLDERDLLRPHTLARSIVKAWTKLGLTMAFWRDVEPLLQKRWGERAHEAYHEANRWLIAQGVLPEIDLRPFIRRSVSAGKPPSAAPAVPTAPTPPSAAPSPASDAAPSRSHVASGSALGPTAQAAHEAAARGGVRSGHVPLSSATAPIAAPVAPAAPIAGAPAALSEWLSANGLADALGGGAGAPAPSARSGVAPGAGGGAVGSGGSGGQPGGLTHGGSGGVAGSRGLPGASQARGIGGGPGGSGSGAGGSGSGAGAGPGGGPGAGAAHGAGRPSWAEETRLMTQQAGGHSGETTGLAGGALADLVERHLPGFKDSASGGARGPSTRLEAAMQEVQAQLQARSGRASRAGSLTTGSGSVTDLSPAALVQQLQERHAALKAAATSPGERATIELVALMFQSILTEERLPAAIRVWFARLQMPTLRVALAEPEFFSSEQHPARRLIDRMGGSVMGFEGAHSERVGSALEAEIKRVVQVIEAFPDTGRRVFQTVLNEFEKFLETYFRDRSDNARRAVSLAQQIEQRQALAVQYTIELRKLLDGVPVPEAVRQFLFQMWADVLATVAVRHGNHSEPVYAIRDAASELVWAVSAKTQPDERLDMVRRTPALISMLRHGMRDAGVVWQKQGEALRTLHDPLAAAFSAEAVAIDPNALAQLQLRLATLEDLLPEEGLAPDESWVMDEALYEYDDVEVVADGGSMPTPETLARVGRMQTGESFLLERGGRQELVRLVWQGLHQQLWLFTGSHGCLLFQKARLASYLQAGLLLPAQDDTLMTKATRAALRQIKAEPGRLLAV